MFDFLKFTKSRSAKEPLLVESFNENACIGSRKNELLQQCWADQLPVVVPGGAGGKAVILPRTSDTFCM